MSSFFEERLEPLSSIKAMLKMVIMALRDMVTAIMRSKSRSSLILKNEAVGFRPKVLHLLELLQTKKLKTKEKY